MRAIREILLTEYIGAIVVAVLVADAFTALITTVVAQITYHLQFRDGAMANVHRLSTTYSALGALTKIVLYLASAYLIARWLYHAKANESTSAQDREKV
jgi:hypothetical protein